MKLKRYRILYVELPGNIGGTITGLYELVRHLDTNRYEPVVLFHRKNHPFQNRFEDIGVKVLSLDASESENLSTSSEINAFEKIKRRLGRGFRAISVISRTLRIVLRDEIDLIHHNDNLPKDRYTVMAAKLAGIPQVCHIRTLKRLSNFDKYLAKSVDAFVYMSKAIEYVYQSAGISGTQGQVIYDGFDPATYDKVDGTKIAAVRDEFDVLKDDWLISNVGRLDNWKGQDYFLEAIAEVVHLHPNIKVLLVGAPETTPWNQLYYRKLKQMVNELDLTHHVIFTGHRNDIPSILLASNIMVHSSSQPEPFGRVVVEGMLAKCPVIATAAGGVLDIIRDGVTGLLVSPKDASRMAKAMLQLLSDKKYAVKMGELARKEAIEHFSIEQHVKGIQNVYDDILKD